jgi:hypothetical protein
VDTSFLYVSSCVIVYHEITCFLMLYESYKISKGIKNVKVRTFPCQG